jgi:hypothetical protein
MRRGVNAIQIGGKQYLLTLTAGEAAHLSRKAGPDEARRSAVASWDLNPEWQGSRVLRRDYERAALTDPRWAETTLCGRHWIIMAAGEGGDVGESGDEVSAPTCRRRLALMDRFFPEPELDDRFALVVQVVTDTVAEHGYAELRGVPGDHHAALRKHV